jgi:uncharacterized repeat protein (TIGR01451 family)
MAESATAERPRVSSSVLHSFLLGIAFSAGAAYAQAIPAVIAKSFSPPAVELNGTSDLTITVTNPNAAVPLTNVQFSDTMPAGIDLITQVGGTCSTPATGGGMFTINPGTEFFSSTSTVLAGGQSCTIVVRVRGSAIGVHLNTTSSVTSDTTPAGAAASATLTVNGAFVPAIPGVSPWSFALLVILLMAVWRYQLRRDATLT